MTERHVRFEGNVLILGSGSVAQCLLPLLLRHIDMGGGRITVLDMVDRRDEIMPVDPTPVPVSFVQQRLTKENVSSVLDELASRGDLIVNLTWNVYCLDVITWCRGAGVLYVDTALESWESATEFLDSRPTDRTLYSAHMELRKCNESWRDEPGPTAVVEHGANPGLVSHWVKVALDDITTEVLASTSGVSPDRQARLRTLKEGRAYAHLAKELGVKVIHVSERDTQIANAPKEVGEFVNTWSVRGLFEEGIGPAELGWGTHETSLPPLAYVHEEGPRNQICLAKPGIETWVRSWVPQGGQIVGMMIQHGESFTISDHLTVWRDGVAEYRPTVHYAYLPTDAAISSLQELVMNGYSLQERQRVMGPEITSGRDELGVLLMGHDLNGWWTGSQLSIEETRELVGGQNATTLQVAASLLGAVVWIIRNPERGVCVPDDLDHHDVLKVADPYLGPRVSVHTDWTPHGAFDPFSGYNATFRNGGWELSNFLVK